MQNKRASPKAPGLGVKFSPAQKDLEAVRWSIAVAQFTRPDCPNGPAYLTLAMTWWHDDVPFHPERWDAWKENLQHSYFTCYQRVHLPINTAIVGHHICLYLTIVKKHVVAQPRHTAACKYLWCSICRTKASVKATAVKSEVYLVQIATLETNIPWQIQVCIYKIGVDW